MTLSRRNLLCTGLVGTAAAAGLTAAQAKSADKKTSTKNWDVFVVGAGFAGMCAALEAAERGSKTILLEKMGRPDGTTVYSSGWIAAVGSRSQKEHPDTPEAFFNDMMQHIALACTARETVRYTNFDWAQKEAMSERTLTRLVKRETGLSLADWILSIRLLGALTSSSP